MRSEGTGNGRQVVVALLVGATLAAALVGAEPAFAASAPVIENVSIGPSVNSAVVVASILTNGSDTSWQVDYGTTAAYGSTFPVSATVLTGDLSGVSESGINLTGLSPNTTYHYSVTANNAGGTVSTPDATFTTDAAMPVPAFNAACVLGADSTDATLRGRIFTYGMAVSSWTLDYGTTLSYELGSVAGGTLPGDLLGANEVTASLSGLTAGQSYHYRFSATNANGTAHGSDQTFTAGSAAANCGYGPPDATGLPPKLGSVSAVAVGTSLIVTANVFTYGTATNWSIDYGTTTSYGTTDAVGSVDADTGGSSGVTATITGLTASTPYDLKVTVSNGLGSDSSTNVAVSTTTADDLCLLKLCPVAGTASYDQTAATLSTVIYTYGVSSTTWSVEYGLSQSYGSTVSGGTAAADANDPTPVSVSLAGLASGTYHYRIDATNARGSTQGADATFVVP